MLENELWTAFILAGKSALLYGMGGIGKTEMAKAVLKKIYSLPCDVTGIYPVSYTHLDVYKRQFVFSGQ